MLRLIVIACLLIAPAAHAARPQLIHQAQTLQKPAGYYFFGSEIAIDGDWALISAATPDPPPGQTQRHDALLYHFVNGQWTFDRVLVSRLQVQGEDLVYFRSFAMSNGLAAIGSNPTHVFRRTNNTWAEISHPFTAPPGDPDHVMGALEWDGNTLLAEKITCTARPRGARISTLRTDGTWTALQRLTLEDDCVLRPSSWAISGDTVVAGTISDYPEIASDQMRVFRRGGATWQFTSSVLFGGSESDLRGNEMFFAAPLPGAGARVYRNDDTLTLVDRLRTVTDSYREMGFSLTHSSDVVLRDRDVFRKNAGGRYEHVAQLVTRGDLGLSGEPEISGRHVLSRAVLHNDSSFPVVSYHQLPATYTPSPVIATGFTNGTAPFTPVIGSFTVATTPSGNRVYRQTSVNGEHRALLNNSDWEEQSIEADINPTALGGWAGLAVRHLDDANYYYVAVRQSGRIALEKMRNGERTPLREVQVTSRTGTNWHVALQVLNRQLRVLVDGKEVIRYFDLTPIPHGSAALVGNATAVDYDNVLVAQVGQSPIFDLQQYGWCNGSLVYTNFYTVTGSGSWSCDYDPSGSGSDIMRQTETADIARVVIGGGPTDDQVIGSRVRLTAFNGPDRWLGIIARYVDASNYYYLTLRGSNTVSLRKLVNGVPTVLVTANLPVTVNTWYDLRLDAVGNELRAFVNNRQVLQTTDASHPVGRTGMLTNKAAAEFSNFMVWQP